MYRNKAEIDEAFCCIQDLEGFGMDFLLHLARRNPLSKERSLALRALLLHTIENNIDSFVKQESDSVYSSDDLFDPEDTLSPPSSEDDYDSSDVDEDCDFSDDDDDELMPATPSASSGSESVPSPSDGFEIKALYPKYENVEFSVDRLRKAIRDGFSSYSNMTFDKETRRHKSWHVAIQGKRNYMEDQVCVLNHPSELLAAPELDGVSYYGVYDGHGGACAAKYILRRLHSRVLKNALFPPSDKKEGVFDGVSKSLSEEICKIDTEFNDASQLNSWKSGTTCIVSVVHGDNLVAACVGDSQSVLYKNGKPVAMHKVHSPGLPEEKERIQEAGGCVLYYAGAWRVNGSIGVSRSIGDPAFRTMLIPDPDVQGHSIDGADYMVMATDGLWDVVKEAEVPAILLNARTRNYKKAKLVAKMERIKRKKAGNDEEVEIKEEEVDYARVLCKEALKRGSRDNISVVFVLFGEMPELECKQEGSSSSSSSSLLVLAIPTGNTQHLQLIEIGTFFSTVLGFIIISCALLMKVNTARTSS
mmetsp:Transcript_23156/g.36087  ORF Transcript_23156/g.36087 Transcript_23156/m.36087 type:complete len:531 (-) Transcript_23156:29-1621(-)